MIRVRRATPEDVPVIAEINVRGWQAAFRELFPDEFLDSAEPTTREPIFAERVGEQPPHHALVAEVRGVVVGFVILGPPEDEELEPDRVHELWGLYIEPARFRTGVGRLLIDHALAYLREGDWESAILWTLKDVERTCRFYEVAGWYRDGAERAWELPKGNHVTLVRYRFDLSGNGSEPPATHGEDGR